MTRRQDIVSSLILAPIRSGLRGFCLLILGIFSMEYQQKNPLKYYALPFLFGFVNRLNILEKLLRFFVSVIPRPPCHSPARPRNPEGRLDRGIQRKELDFLYES